MYVHEQYLRQLQNAVLKFELAESHRYTCVLQALQQLFILPGSTSAIERRLICSAQTNNWTFTSVKELADSTAKHMKKHVSISDTVLLTRNIAHLDTKSLIHHDPLTSNSSH